MDRSAEAVVGEIASVGLISLPHHAALDEWLGSAPLLPRPPKKQLQGLPVPQPTFTQLRAALAEFAIFPLGCKYVHAR